MTDMGCRLERREAYVHGEPHPRPNDFQRLWLWPDAGLSGRRHTPVELRL